MLVYYEATESVVSALERERQIKAGSRQDKINLINSMNPECGAYMMTFRLPRPSREFWEGLAKEVVNGFQSSI